MSQRAFAACGTSLGRFSSENRPLRAGTAAPGPFPARPTPPGPPLPADGERGGTGSRFEGERPPGPGQAAGGGARASKGSVILVFLPSRGELVGFVFSRPYSLAADPTAVLLVGMIFLGTASVFQTVLVAVGKPKAPLLVSPLCLVVGLAGNIVLIPRLGVLGAAVGSSAAFVVYSVALGLITVRRVKVGLPFPVLLRCLAAAVPVLALSHLWKTAGVVALLEAVVMFALYLALLLALRELRGDDLEALRLALRRGAPAKS